MPLLVCCGKSCKFPKRREGELRRKGAEVALFRAQLCTEKEKGLLKKAGT